MLAKRKYRINRESIDITGKPDNLLNVIEGFNSNNIIQNVIGLRLLIKKLTLDLESKRVGINDI